MVLLADDAALPQHLPVRKSGLKLLDAALCNVALSNSLKEFYELD